jgi:hypothetical protein
VIRWERGATCLDSGSGVEESRFGQSASGQSGKWPDVGVCGLPRKGFSQRGHRPQPNQSTRSDRRLRTLLRAVRIILVPQLRAFGGFATGRLNANERKSEGMHANAGCGLHRQWPIPDPVQARHLRAFLLICVHLRSALLCCAGARPGWVKAHNPAHAAGAIRLVGPSHILRGLRRFAEFVVQSATENQSHRGPPRKQANMALRAKRIEKPQWCSVAFILSGPL